MENTTHTLSVDGYLRDIIGMHALAEMSANKPNYAGIHLSILNTDVWQKECFLLLEELTVFRHYYTRIINRFWLFLLA